MNDPSTYRPGACNIGPAEIRRRRRSGIAGLLTAGTLAVLMLVAGTAPVLRWIVVAPLYLGIIGFVQAQLRFCVRFGLAGLENFGGIGEQRAVPDAGAAGADRRRAILLVGAVALVSIALTAVFVALPA